MASPVGVLQQGRLHVQHVRLSQLGRRRRNLCVDGEGIPAHDDGETSRLVVSLTRLWRRSKHNLFSLVPRLMKPCGGERKGVVRARQRTNTTTQPNAESQQQNITQQNSTQLNTTQHNTTPHHTTQHNTTRQHNTTHTKRLNTTQLDTTRHDTTLHYTTLHYTTRHYTSC